MAVGPLHYIDLTLDDEGLSTSCNKYAHASGSFINKEVIELSDDSDAEEGQLYNATSHSKTYKRRLVDRSDDKIMAVKSLAPFLHRSRSPDEASLSQDEALARRLSRQYDGSFAAEAMRASSTNSEDNGDEELAWQLQLDGNPEEYSQDELLARRLAEEWDEEQPLQSVSAEDERLARELAQQEEDSFNGLLQSIEGKEDGIVFSVVVNAADDTLEDGSPAHPDDLERFRPWKTLFEKSGHKVKRFHWFVNYELEKRFEQARTKLEEITGQPSQELQLFHGTNSANIDSILKGGFRIGGVGGHPLTNGAAFGCGIYLAGLAATSIQYALGGNRIFACRVVPGRVTSKVMQAPPRSIEVGTEIFDCYHGNGIYVHRYSSLVLPCYMIEYDGPTVRNVPGIGVRGVTGGGMPIGAGPGVIGLGIGGMGVGLGGMGAGLGGTGVGLGGMGAGLGGTGAGLGGTGTGLSGIGVGLGGIGVGLGGTGTAPRSRRKRNRADTEVETTTKRQRKTRIEDTETSLVSSKGKGKARR